MSEQEREAESGMWLWRTGVRELMEEAVVLVSGDWALGVAVGAVTMVWTVTIDDEGGAWSWGNVGGRGGEVPCMGLKR